MRRSQQSPAWWRGGLPLAPSRACTEMWTSQAPTLSSGPSASLSEEQNQASAPVRFHPFSIPATPTALTNYVAWARGEESHCLFTVGKRTPTSSYIRAIYHPLQGKQGWICEGILITSKGHLVQWSSTCHYYLGKINTHSLWEIK